LIDLMIYRFTDEFR